MRQLTKNQESLVRALYSRHGRKKYGMCVCEGLRCVDDLVQACPELIEFILVSEESDYCPDGLEVVTASHEKLEKLSATVASQGIIAVARKPETSDFTTVPDDPFIFILDRIGDPGNFGTMLRTARAVGLKELWYTAGSVDPFNDKVIRSGMGAQFVLKMRCFNDLSELRESLLAFGYKTIFRTDPHQGENCFAQPGLFNKSGIIIGSEASGAGSIEGAKCITIPMPGSAESLNAAQAATIILFEYVRRIS